MKNSVINKYLAVMVFNGFFITPGAEAVDIPIKITAEIVIPPCTINNNQSLEVNFGDVPITDVVNTRFHQKKDVSIVCTYYKGIPYIKVIGTQLSGANANVLSTNISDFGIALYQGDGVSTPMNLGSGSSNGKEYIGYPVTNGLDSINTAGGTFTFTAAPFHLGDNVLSTGQFFATASMSVSYL